MQVDPTLGSGPTRAAGSDPDYYLRQIESFIALAQEKSGRVFKPAIPNSGLFTAIKQYAIQYVSNREGNNSHDEETLNNIKAALGQLKVIQNGVSVLVPPTGELKILIDAYLARIASEAAKAAEIAFVKEVGVDITSQLQGLSIGTGGGGGGGGFGGAARGFGGFGGAPRAGGGGGFAIRPSAFAGLSNATSSTSSAAAAPPPEDDEDEEMSGGRRRRRSSRKSKSKKSRKSKKSKKAKKSKKSRRTHRK